MELTHGKSLSFQQFINIGLLITSGKGKKKRRTKSNIRFFGYLCHFLLSLQRYNTPKHEKSSSNGLD